MTCKNCGNKYEGNFCNNCGQKASTKRFDLRGIFNEVLISFINLDKGLIFTTRQLLFYPGRTIRNYLNGRRIDYTKPFAYLFYLGAVYIILVNLAGSYTNISDSLNGMVDALSEGESDVNILLVKTLKWLSRNYVYSLLLIIPFFSLSSYLSFRKQRFNYSEHLIINSFVIGLQLFLAILLTLLQIPFSERSLTFEILNYTILGLGFLTPVWCYYSLFDSYHPVSRLLRTVFTFVVLTILIVILLIVSVGLAVAFK